MRSILPRSVLAALIAFGFAAGAFAQSSDVFVTKTSPATANPGDNVTFTITVGNAGPDPAPNATLTDTLPSGSTFVSEMQTSGPAFNPCSKPSGGSFGGTVTCTIPSLATGATATFQVIVNAPLVGSAGTTLINSATMTSDNPDPNSENNSSISGTTISGGNLSDVGVMKTGPPSALPGTNVTFTITVSDFGPNNASSVTLNDTLGAGLTFVSLNQTSGPAFSCPGNTTPCSIATLPNGSSATFSLVATVSSTPGTYTNSASVTSANDPNPENDAASASVIVSNADLGVTKSGPATANAGQNINYTVTVTNGGPDTATTAGFNDTLPPGTMFVSAVQNSGPAAACEVNGSAISCKTAVLANGQSESFTVTAAINSGVPNGTILSNTATTVQDGADSNPNNNSSTASTTVTATADLSIAKSGPASVVAGTNVTYTISVTNAGPSDAASVQMSDTLPAGETFVSEMQTSGPVFTCTTGATISCSVATLTSGATASFTIVARVGSGATGAISNTATISSTTSDTNPGNNTSTSTAAVTTSADVAVTKSASPNPVPAGSNLTYTIHVTNNGPSDAASVSLSDTLPPNTTFVSMTQTAGPAFICSGTSTQTCTIASLVNGGSASFQLVAQVSAAAVVGSMISNTATVSSATSDSNAGNNSATATTTVVAPAADVSVTKTASPPSSAYPIDFNVTFTITASNGGPSTATNVTVTDTLPSNMTLVSSNSTQGTCAGTTTITCAVGTLASGSTATITIVAQTVSQGNATNTATISSAEADPNPANNTASISFLISNNVPTLSPLLLALLALAFAAIATRLLTE